jgi:two-component system sensor histidine kinase YesM
MKEISAGKLDTKIEVSGNDEIKEISNVFNEMTEDIKGHIDEIVEKDKAEKEIKLRLFMSQINPHFIYNTLNTIIYLARKEGNDKIISVTKNFINILHNTIQVQPDEMTTVDSEIKFIGSYIKILRYRYNNIVDLDWEVEPDAMDKKLPRMMLYPLIENSVFHGIIPKNKTGKIAVKLVIKDKHLNISVVDNGLGIEDNALADLKDLLRKNKDLGYIEHIGLFNVNHRLSLLYGEDNTLEIQSKYGEGTKISFKIPIDSD